MSAMADADSATEKITVANKGAFEFMCTPGFLTSRQGAAIDPAAQFWGLWQT